MIFRTPAVRPDELAVVERIEEIRRRLKHILRGPQRWTGLMRRNLMARAIQGSNTIEGYTVTFEEAVAVVEEDEIDIKDETRRALEGYRSALTYILHLADDEYFSLNEELIRSLHYMMLSYDQSKLPGMWRPGPIYVRREPSGERAYEGPDAGMVPGLVHELVQDIQGCDQAVPAMVRAAMAHLNLVMIHPFKDGNGRMGRALQTLVLAREGVVSPVFASIEEYLGSRSNTDSYYSVLAKTGSGTWNPQEDARPWVRFCLRAHLHQAITVDRRAKETSRLFSDLEAELERRGLNERLVYALYEAAIGFRVKSSRYRRAADVSAQVASKDLKILVNDGLLAASGEKRGRSYIATPYLVELRDKCREPRQPMPDLFGE